MDIIEISITTTIIIAAGILLFRSIRKKAKGECDCGCCSNHCPKYYDRDRNGK